MLNTQHSTVVPDVIQTVSSYLTSCLLCHTADDPLDALHPHLELHVVGGVLQLVDADYLEEPPSLDWCHEVGGRSVQVVTTQLAPGSRPQTNVM